jgi:hypothetical protein
MRLYPSFYLHLGLAVWFTSFSLGGAVHFSIFCNHIVVYLFEFAFCFGYDNHSIKILANSVLFEAYFQHIRRN